MAQGNQNRLKKKHYNAALLILNMLEKKALAGNMNAAALYLRKTLPDLRAMDVAIEVKTVEQFCIVRDARAITKTSTD